jgi:RNA polymerase sigma-70 factor (ECF subfamily)
MPSPLQNIARHTNFDRLLPSNFAALATILNIESWNAERRRVADPATSRRSLRQEGVCLYPMAEKPISHSSSDPSPRGDEFMRLYLAHEHKIRGYILCLVSNWADADDIQQQAAVVMWKKYATFSAKQHFLHWALRIAHYEIMNHLRKKRNRLPGYSSSVLEALEAKAAQAVQEEDRRREALQKCVARLRPRDQELLRLRYEAGATVQGVALTVERSVGAVYKALNRIHYQLLLCIRSRLVQQEEAL